MCVFVCLVEGKREREREREIWRSRRQKGRDGIEVDISVKESGY